MTNYDIERIEKFMDMFELSMNDIFSLLGFGVCQIEKLSIVMKDTFMESLHNEMNKYIYNDLAVHKRGV